MQDKLIARLRLGDLAALEEIMDRYGPYSAKILEAFLGRSMTREDLEEALSDVFVALWNSRDRIEGEDLRPYLAAIARNMARQRLRRRRPEEPLPEEEILLDGAPGPETLAETAETAAELRRAVNGLPEEERALFLRFYYLEQTTAEIAAATGENEATLRSRLRRGREKLRRYLTERGMAL